MGDYQVRADLAAMPIENMALMFGGIILLIILLAALLFLFVNRLGVRGGIGSLRIGSECASSEYHMNRKIDEIDRECKGNMRRHLGPVKNRVGIALSRVASCAHPRLAISTFITLPLGECISNNHFTTEFQPENYGEYRRRVIALARDEYEGMARADKPRGCPQQALPEWSEIGAEIEACVVGWLMEAGRETIRACKKKIAVYDEFKRYFEEAKDSFRSGIARKCMDKNERYIVAIEAMLRGGGA